MKYKDLIPVGYPIFEYGRRLSCKKFTPSESYVNYLIEQYNLGNKNTYSFDGNRGEYETEEDFKKYVNWEVSECKSILETKLNKKIHTLCFPGGGYNDYVLSETEKSGYLCYMHASRLRVGNNFDHLKKLRKNEFTGFNRTSFSQIHPKFLPKTMMDYWTAKLSLGTYQNKKLWTFFKKCLSKILHA